jgi:hypothetical protein
MNRLSAKARGWLIWLVPFVVLAAVIGWEADWGRKWRHVPATDAAVVPQPVVVAVLPEYTPAAAPTAQRDMVERALFNPTRRPAPVAAPEAAKRRIQPGQFTLTGTMIIDGKSTAFLRENAGGKARRVAQGEEVNGMLVAEVKPDRVRLTLGEDSEELVLRVAAGPKTTTQPVVAAPPAGVQGAPGQGGVAQPAAGQTAADLLAERRRAQQAAQAGTNTPGLLNAPPPGAYARPGGEAVVGAPVDPRWAEGDARVRARAAAAAARSNSAK